MNKLLRVINSLVQACDWHGLKIAGEARLHQHTDDVVGLNALGIALFNLGRREEGLNTVRHAREVDASSAMTLDNLANMLFAAGETLEAISCWKEAVRMGTDRSAIYQHLGMASFRVQDFAWSTQWYEKCAKRPDATQEARESYAAILFFRGRYSECISYGASIAARGDSKPSSRIKEYVVLSQGLLHLYKAQKRRGEKWCGRDATFIFGATGRSGTTMLQRLLNSSKQIMMFGEDEYLGRRLPEAALHLALTHFDMGPGIDDDWRRFKRGEDFWSPRLYPALPEYLEIAMQAFNSAAEFMSTAAQRQRQVRKWGIKLPDSSGMRTLMSLLPEAKFIFVYRNLFDVARSYKARGWLPEIGDVKKLGETWSKIFEFLPIESDRFLALKYEDFVANSSQWVDRLQEFVGIDSIDSGILGRKFNVFDSVEPSGYIQPSQLTAEEIKVLEEAGGWAIRELGYARQPGSQTARN